PMVVAYRVKPLTYWLAKKMVKTEFVSLPNLLAGKKIVPELIQEDCTVERLTAKLGMLLSQDNRCLKRMFREFHQTIRCDADHQAANAVLALVNKND
ncbi:MAG: lipid-A-disaccharide synthase, partial [Plesiomonas sp.]